MIIYIYVYIYNYIHMYIFDIYIYNTKYNMYMYIYIYICILSYTISSEQFSSLLSSRPGDFAVFLLPLHGWHGPLCGLSTKHQRPPTGSGLSQVSDNGWSLRFCNCSFHQDQPRFSGLIPKFLSDLGIRAYFLGIFPYIGLKNRPYIW
jgi:hypothetical protein